MEVTITIKGFKKNEKANEMTINGNTSKSFLKVK